MRHMSSELHFKSCNTKVAQLSVVQYKVCIIQLDHIHRVVQNHRVGSLHKPKQIIFWMSLVWLLNESKLQNTRLRSKLLLGMVQLKFMIFIMYQNLNQSEWLMNDYWITIEWQLNDYWMTTELLLNDYWMTTEWHEQTKGQQQLLNHYQKQKSFTLPLNFICLCKSHFCHVIRIWSNLKFTGLRVQREGVKPHGTNEADVGGL